MSNQVINQEATVIQPSSLITLFVLDASMLVPSYVNGIFRFHSGTSIKGKPIVWQGNVYDDIPCESEGWQINGQGTAPRPKIRFNNVRGLFTDLVLNYQDLVGAKVIRKRTFYSRLDSVNYPDYDSVTNPNANPNADPLAQIPDDIFSIIRKTNEDRSMVEFELGPPSDVENIMLPGRTTSVHLCKWHYRDGDCGEAEDFVFATEDDIVVPSSSVHIRYFGAYDNTATYPIGSVVWITGVDPSLKDFYFAPGVSVVGEDIATSANWQLIQRYTGEYNPNRVYSPGMTCYKILGLSGVREYYYNAISCIGVEPPASNFWITDRCSLHASGCKIRFSEDPRGLPYGGFLGLNYAPIAGGQ
jgi:lambda family phage minor tail protein L